jgi:hypothetical protein
VSQIGVVTVAALAFVAAPAWAYLDPGTGSYVFQVVAAALVSVGFLARAYWHRLRTLLGRRGRSSPQAPPDGR